MARIVICLLFFSQILIGQEEVWTELFNNQNLDNWEVKNGKADYLIQDETIVGIAQMNTPNTFLCTKEHYADFILEFDVQVDPRLNSGVQIRSNSLENYHNGRVHGYQVEIDPSKRAYSGGIYDEGRRGWLTPLAQNERGRKAFVNGHWNHFRVEAIGHSIRVWVNGINTCNIVDDWTEKGFIGLQVHSIGDKSLVGAKVKWRNIRIKTSDLENARKNPDPLVVEENFVANTLTQQEKRKGWRLLWDGKSTDGWRSARSMDFPDKGWVIENGILTVLETGGDESRAGGDIITKDKFSNFELKLEFKITKGANSGIKYFVDPELNKGPGSSIGLEYQILDDQAHPDAKMGVKGNRTCASLYDLITAKNLSVPGRHKDFRGIGKWNQARIVVNGNHIEHWLNGFKVIEYERNTQMYRALVAYSKYKVWPNFGELPEGHILLQDHGNEVSFRSIKIREF